SAGMVLAVIAKIQSGGRIEGPVFRRAIGDPVGTSPINGSIGRRRRWCRCRTGDRSAKRQSAKHTGGDCCPIAAAAIIAVAMIMAAAPTDLLHELPVWCAQGREAGRGGGG